MGLESGVGSGSDGLGVGRGGRIDELVAESSAGRGEDRKCRELFFKRGVADGETGKGSSGGERGGKPLAAGVGVFPMPDKTMGV